MIVDWLIEHALPLFAIAIAVVNFIWLLQFREKLQMSWKAALLVAILHVVIGWSSMRLMAILEVGGNLEKAANMRLFGAVFVLPFFYYAWAKFTHKDLSLVMDIAAICLVVGLICGRFDCLVGGCCRGTRIPGTAFYWPLREIELIFYFAFLAIFCKKIILGKTCGQVYPVYLISYGALRFILEWFRQEYTTRIGIFHLAHIWALLSLVLGISFYAEVTQRSKKQRERGKRT